MKDVKENLVQWTDWDSNRECLKFDKVSQHSNSTKTITANHHQCIITRKCIASDSHYNTVHHTSLPNPLGHTSFITRINFATLFRVC